MKTFALAAALAATIVSGGSASAQSAPSGIPGTFDPTTRVFVPQPASTTTATSRAAASRSGQVNVAMTITIASSIPTTTPIVCGLAISHMGVQGAYYTEAAQTPAVRSGSTATCTVRIPYLWSLADTAMPVQPQISVTADRRQLMHILPNFLLPANGGIKAINQSLRF
jgi:hypothetical protein